MVLSEGDRIELLNTFLMFSPIKSTTTQSLAKPRSNSAPAWKQLTSQTKQELVGSPLVLSQIESLNALLQCKDRAAAHAKLASQSSTVLLCCKVEQLAHLQVEPPHGFGSECSDGVSSQKVFAFDKDGRSNFGSASQRLDTLQAASSQSPDQCGTSLTWMAQEYATLPPCPCVSDTTLKLWNLASEGRHLNMEQDEESITTAMLHNIPFKYTVTELAEELDALGMMGTYDFLYLPVRGRRRCERINLGYAFINLRPTEMFDKFAQALHNYRFAKHMSRRISRARVSRASIQGLAANLSSVMGPPHSDGPPSGLLLFNTNVVVG